MKKQLLSVVALMCISFYTFSQTTAQDWTKTDCDNNSHTLFSELDNGKICVMLFPMMGCGSCSFAGGYIQQIYEDYQATGLVNVYAIGYSDSYTCSQMQNWASSYSFTFPMMTKGASDITYYGGMGMPTIVVTGNNTHKVYYKKLGFAPSDDAIIRSAIDQALADGATGLDNNTVGNNHLNIYPNPSQNISTVSYSLKNSADVTLEILNVLGEKVMTLRNVNGQTGENTTSINTAKLSNGVYYLRIKTDNYSDALKMVVSH